jgi:filamentous hemagglutinin
LSAIPSIDDLIYAASALDRRGFTKAGRALQKHGNRPHSAFPQPLGSPAAINAAAATVVEEILRDPGSQFVIRQTKRYGAVIEVRAPDRRGIRYDGVGNFIGLLEP